VPELPPLPPSSRISLTATLKYWDLSIGQFTQALSGGETRSRRWRQCWLLVGLIHGSNTSLCELGSSVSIVSGYGLDDPAIEVRSPVETKEFFL
jgi:hypothetical protein